MKNILGISILASLLLVLIIFNDPIIYWFKSDEFKHTMEVLFVAGLVFIVVGIFAANRNIIYETMKEKEFFDDVADKVDNAKTIRIFEDAMKIREELREQIHNEVYGNPPIDIVEMKQNAELALTYDQQAHLRMLRNNPHFKIDTKA